jgi:hypothetical protein
MSHQVPHEVNEVHQVPPGAHHVNLIHEEFYQVRRHRHQAWASFTLTLCRGCLQNCIRKHHVRYPVSAVDPESCQCPCRANEVAA